MIENPLENFYLICPYVKENNYDLRYGDFFILQDNSPKEIVKKYQKYIDLIKKVLVSWDCFVIEDKTIKGIEKGLEGKAKEQAEIVLELIRKGVINAKIIP